MSKKRISLKVKSIIMIIVAGLVSLGLFLLLQMCSIHLMDNYFTVSDYNEHKNYQYLDKLQNYVTENNISASDGESLEEWVERYKLAYISISVYREKELLYESYYRMIDLDDDEEDEYPLSFYSKDIMFEDGEATVYMLGYFDNQFYVAASYLELLISILVFLGIYAAVVESKINYVMLLEREIEILETGGLEHAITVKGNDELSALAEELNQMRLTLYDTMQREKDAVQMNYNLVVSVAHDLRTPLTALMLYLNLLYNKKYKDEKQMEKYIEKSMLKAEQIRNMSDQLFERFLLSREEEPVSEAPQKAQYIFEDILSDMMVYLESDQYKVESRIEWPDVRLCVVPDYIERIMNNLSSNLIKYADKTVPVVIYLHIEKKQLILGVRNKIQIGADKQESTKVGIQNMQIMMQKMDGSISIEHTPEFFEIRLNFVIAV